MERKSSSREGPRRLSTKLSKGTEMKKVSRQLGMAAAESDKDSGFSGRQLIAAPVVDRPALL
uniref:CLOCK interacting pacemaker n=1 Tax=Sus scrofa TaxID=9823 RepID=A0A8D1VSG6_PIG